MIFRFVYVCIVGFSFSNEIYQQIKVDNVSDDDISLFQYSGIEFDHADYRRGEYIEFAISNRDLSILNNLGYEYQVVHHDLQKHYESRLTSNYTREFGLGSMGGYYTLDEAIQRLDAIHDEYPQFVSEKFSLGQTFEGRDIWAIKISNNPNLDENEPEVLFTGMHHSREPMSFMNLYYYIYWLLENYEINDEARNIIDNR